MCKFKNKVIVEINIEVAWISTKEININEASYVWDYYVGSCNQILEAKESHML